MIRFPLSISWCGCAEYGSVELHAVRKCFARSLWENTHFGVQKVAFQFLRAITWFHNAGFFSNMLKLSQYFIIARFYFNATRSSCWRVVRQLQGLFRTQRKHGNRPFLCLTTIRFSTFRTARRRIEGQADRKLGLMKRIELKAPKSRNTWNFACDKTFDIK